MTFQENLREYFMEVIIVEYRKKCGIQINPNKNEISPTVFSSFSA